MSIPNISFLCDVYIYCVLYVHFRMDEAGNILHYKEYKLPNGNWDAFLDARIGSLKMDCIYPDIPRVAHQGANGYTVSATAQAELFDNLRLSILPITINYGDLNRLIKSNYEQHILQFIRKLSMLLL